MKKQSGFTLIELIIVIVILGILAVTAAPQFFNFGSDARESTVRGMEGSVKAAADLVFARSAINGVEQDPTGDIDNNGDIKVVFGYPEASDEGIIVALNADFGEAGVGGDWDYNVDNAPVIITPAGRDAIEVGDPADDKCQVEYTQAGAAGERPTIEAFTAGC